MSCTRHHSQYVYHASAFAMAGEFERPRPYSLAPQASVVLGGHGGHGTSKHPGLTVDGLVSFKSAYSEVGGSYDDCHDVHTTHAWSVLEGVDVAGILTADRVVSRLAIYYRADDSEEASFDITGSHFENLRIAGHPVDVKLDTQLFHKHDTYSKVTKSHHGRKNDHWLMGSGLRHESDAGLKRIEDEYHALRGMAKMVKEWKKAGPRPPDMGHYRLSAANHLDWSGLNRTTELEGYGAIICIPKFGVIRLAEVSVTRHHRSLTMFRVQMCSCAQGTGSGPTSGGSGG
jgi:hypothetical protein